MTSLNDEEYGHLHLWADRGVQPRAGRLMPHFYHFTSAMHLEYIKNSRALRPSESNVGSPLPFWEPCGVGVGPAVVWLLDTPTAEGFSHGLMGSAYDKTAVRITVDVPAVAWNEWEPAQKMHPDWRGVFVDAGGGPEAAAHWYVFEGEIPESHWIDIAPAGAK